MGQTKQRPVKECELRLKHTYIHTYIYIYIYINNQITKSKTQYR